MRIKAGQYFASLILFLENLLKAHPQTENCLGQLFFLSVVWANLFYGHNYFNVTITR